MIFLSVFRSYLLSLISFYSSSILSNTYFIFSHWWSSWEILQIHRKKNFLNEQKIEKYQSKATLAKDRNRNWRIFFSKRRQHKKTSNSNVFDQNHRIRTQKENIERQRILNIKTTIESETRKLKRRKKKLKEKTFTKEKNDEIDEQKRKKLKEETFTKK